MRRITSVRALTGFVIVVGLTVPTAGQAAPTHAQSDGYPDLTGVTRISAARSSYGIVDLPSTVRFRTTAGPGTIHGLDLDGAGRFVGLALVSLDGRHGFVQLRMSTCWHPSCVARPGAFTRPQIAASWGVSNVSAPSVRTKLPDGFRLPAGRYVLSVYTDGAPVDATLRLPGLGGSSPLALHLNRHSQEASPQAQRFGTGPVTTMATSDAVGSVDTSVVVLGSVHKESSSPHVSNDDWWCYSNDPPPGGATAPYCPTESGVGTGITWVTMQYRSISYGVVVEAGPSAINGRVFQGFDDSGVQNLGAVHDNFFWGDAGLPHQGR